MSASTQALSNLSFAPGIVDELLHSLSQPLTSLRCSLELCIDEVPEKQRTSVSSALQETEKVIGMVRLMREYLDADQHGPASYQNAFAPAIHNIIEELSSIAVVRDVRLRLIGTCTATVNMPESRLRLALQYLVTSMIDSQPIGGKVLLLLGEGPAGAVLRVEGEQGLPTTRSSSASTLRHVRLAIARRVLETAGATLVVSNNIQVGSGLFGFVLRIPRRTGISRDNSV